MRGSYGGIRGWRVILWDTIEMATPGTEKGLVRRIQLIIMGGCHFTWVISGGRVNFLVLLGMRLGIRDTY